jgi:hypothetical protein
MAHVAVETNLWDTDEAIALGEKLEDPDAWRFVVRLWAWGLDNDRVTGRIKLPPWRVAQICNFRGEPGHFFDALVDTKWLVEKPDGTHYMRGWSRMKRFFREKKRLRVKQKRYRDRMRKQRNGDGNVTGNGGGNVTGKCLGNTSPSPSPSPSPPIKSSAQGSVKPVQLGPGGNGEPWCWGEPIATFGDFLEATQELRGAAAGWSPTAELRATLEGGPIGEDEYAGIIQRARDSAKGPAWVASGIYRERGRAAELAAAPPPEPKNPNVGWMGEYEDEEDEED